MSYSESLYGYEHAVRESMAQQLDARFKKAPKSGPLIGMVEAEDPATPIDGEEELVQQLRGALGAQDEKGLLNALFEGAKATVSRVTSVVYQRVGHD